MPSYRPGNTFECEATKACVHGQPVIELGFPGVAHKSTQAAPAYPSAANALAAQRIAIGEDMVIVHMGAEGFDPSYLPRDTRVGDAIYITEADNRLVLAADAVRAGALQAGFQKYGRLQVAEDGAGLAIVNLNARSTF